jgi:8-oxo-dGTP pyrophosphatase MutT (NUDIX family)
MYIMPTIYKEKAAGIIVITPDRSKVLLILSKNGFWSIPKGHIEKGETVKKAARRETFEEVGIKIKKYNFIKSFKTTVFQKFYRDKAPDNRAIGNIEKKITFFLAVSPTDKFKIQESEVIEAKWCTWAEAIILMKDSNMFSALLSVAEFLICGYNSTT